MINFIKKFKKVWNEKYLSLYFSILITLCFAAYNAFLGINYLAIWNGSIAVYYILLLVVKCIVCFRSNKVDKKTRDLSLRKYVLSSLLIVTITIALIVPSVLMINHQRPVNLDMIAAITVATFTTYKITIAINLVSAIVSILTLQNTLIMISEEGYTENMKILTIVSTISFLILIACISLLSMINFLRKRNK